MRTTGAAQGSLRAQGPWVPGRPMQEAAATRTDRGRCPVVPGPVGTALHPLRAGQPGHRWPQQVGWVGSREGAPGWWPGQFTKA